MRSYTPRPPVKPLYFSSADVQFCPLLSPRDFSRKLLFYVLFQPQVVMPDIFYFISPTIANHVLASKDSASKDSLLGECTRAGYVIPFFRSGDSFRSALKEIRRQQIVGVTRSAEELAAKLDGIAYDSNGAFDFKPFPDASMGKQFGDRFCQDLGFTSAEDHPGFLHLQESDKYEAIRSEWDSTRDLRLRCRDYAERFACEEDVGHIRRGHVLKAICRFCGIEKPTGYIRNVLAKISDPNLRQNVVFYWKLVNSIYYGNQADLFDVCAAFPSVEPAQILTLYRAFGRVGNEGVCQNTKQFSVDIPPLSVLERLSPKTLLSIRKNYYPDVLTALMLWQQHPFGSDSMVARVKAALNSYAAELNRWAASSFQYRAAQVGFDFSSESRESSWQRVLKMSPTVAKPYAELCCPATMTLSSTLSAVTIRFMPLPLETVKPKFTVELQV